MDLLFRRFYDIGAGVGGVAQAGASVIDTAAQDATNIYLQKQANQFNAQQAALQRGWSAQQAQNQMTFNANQAALGRDFAQSQQQSQQGFEASQQTQAEAYNTEMSDTAVQRRSADIQAAGFNPLLAVGQLGGASTPQMGAPSSSAVGASSASAGIPGGASASSVQPAQVQGFLANAAQLNLATAQAANLRQDTLKKGQETDILSSEASVLAMETTPAMLMKQQQALAAKYDLDYAKASEVEAAVTTIRNGAKLSDYEVALADFQKQLASMDVQAQRATLNTLIDMKNAVQSQQTQEAKNVLWVQSQPYLSKGIAMAQAVLTPVSSAAGAAKSVTGAAKDLVGYGGALF